MNNNKNIKLQFTELMEDDIATHEDLYIDLLIRDEKRVPNYPRAYYKYATKELQKAKDLFYKMFK